MSAVWLCQQGDISLSAVNHFITLFWKRQWRRAASKARVPSCVSYVSKVHFGVSRFKTRRRCSSAAAKAYSHLLEK